jgi:hypothetical protein
MEMAIYIIFTFLFAALVANNIWIRVKNRELFINSVQAELDRRAVYEKFEQITKEQDERNIEKTDGFLRFISESREWAFKYIEDVQDAIKIFDQEVGPIVKHYRETKKSLYSKQLETLGKLAEAYDIVMSLMPDDEKNK